MKINNKMSIIKNLAMIHSSWMTEVHTLINQLPDYSIYKGMSSIHNQEMIGVLHDTIMRISNNKKEKILLANYYYKRLEILGIKHVQLTLNSVHADRTKKEFPRLKPLTKNQLQEAKYIIKHAPKKYRDAMRLEEIENDKYMLFFNEAPIGKQIFAYYMSKIAYEIEKDNEREN